MIKYKCKSNYSLAVTLGENGVVIDGLLKFFETVYDEEGNPVDKEENVIFDGQIGFSGTDENGKHSFTVSVDVDKIDSTNGYSEKYFDKETNEGYFVSIIDKILLVFDGEITFSYIKA